ncbi:MAG: hypothetical protein ACYCSI_11475 [Solirubrobacteraceae bacterium]
MSELFHAAALEVKVEAERAFEYLSDGLRQSDWALGSLERVARQDGLFEGRSSFDGKPTYVRIHADRQRLLVDYDVGRSPDRLLRVNSTRVVPGPLVGRPPGTCLIALTKWRGPSESEEDWRRSRHTFSTEIFIIKGRLELGF